MPASHQGAEIVPSDRGGGNALVLSIAVSIASHSHHLLARTIIRMVTPETRPPNRSDHHTNRGSVVTWRFAVDASTGNLWLMAED